ncbi:MAG TPA: ATP-dependent DNA helicase [Actinomycetota bacterium]|nr:ATP-dependent DNA helicase [Actinomycetota bacterium]
MSHVELDPVQRQAVEHDSGPLLVLGSPGTGKTTVLVERWVRLATDVTAPHRVLMLVPTRERALHLRDELPWRVPADALVEVAVHTWHALAYHLVTRYHRLLGYPQPPVRLTGPEQWAVVRELMEREDPSAWGGFADHLTTDAFTGEVADFCVRAGHRGLSTADLQTLARDRPGHAAVARFAVRYREHLASTSALDYPGLVLEARRLLESDPGVQEALHRRFTHVLVDDAQELAPAQLQLLRCLNLEHLVAAGDPDSAIEAFRGSDPSWLSRFEEVAGAHGTLTLPVAHRFGKAIGDVAASLISHSPDPGPHRAANFEGPRDATAHLRCHQTMAAEIEAAARTIRSAHILDGVAYSSMAVLLAQPSAYAHAVARTLASFSIPHRIEAGDRPLAEEPAVAAVLDLCRVALADEPDDDLLKRVLTSPLVGMHPHRVRELAREAAMRMGVTFAEAVERDTSPEGAEYRSLRDEVAACVDETADETFLRLFEASTWCRELAARRSEADAGHQLEALVSLGRALGYYAQRRPGGTMRTYLQTSGASGATAERWTPSRRPDGVRVLSLHAAKGMEWEVVCVVGVSEGQLPKAHRAQGLFDPWALELGSAVDRALAQLAEERRTLYVGLTRARRTLVVSTSPGSRRASPSRFLEEAFGELPETALPGEDGPPLTLPEAAARLRRTLSDPKATDAQRAAAAAALTQVPGLDPARWWWRRAWTSGPPLRPDGKLVTSYSRISRYDDCPLRYVLESVLGLDPASTYQMKFGSLVHRIFERADPAAGDISTYEQALAEYKREFVEQHRTDYPNDVFARTYYRFGVECIKRWWNTERTSGQTVAIEYSFDDLDMDGHTIRGRIDRVSKDRAGLVLSDYKTSRSALEWDRAKASLQLAIYYMAAKRYPDLAQHGEPAVMQLIYPGIEHTDRRDGSVGCMKRYQKPDEAEDALARLRTILDDAAAERFSPAPDADCQWCRMKPLCPRWPEGREVPR